MKNVHTKQTKNNNKNVNARKEGCCALPKVLHGDGRAWAVKPINMGCIILLGFISNHLETVMREYR